jgi:2-keto-4-pentenoate hydratase/2-oxohepta-3-ene-1,7-dioic acid hydratase in catechol pathway
MRIVRYESEANGPRWGVLEGDRIRPIADPFAGTGTFPSYLPSSASALREVRLLAPVQPSKIVAVAANYPKHAAEMGNAVSEEPRLFLKASSAVIGPGEAILLPPRTARVDPEGELGVVIGRRCSRATPAEAMGCVLGYTIVNDVTARDFQATDRIFGRAKSFDTFCPIGPWIETDVDASDLEIVLSVDGVARAQGRTSHMTHKLPALLSFASSVMTLLPGDVIATGTPPGVAAIVPGNLVSIAIERIGTLENPVRNREDRG